MPPDASDAFPVPQEARRTEGPTGKKQRKKQEAPGEAARPGVSPENKNSGAARTGTQEEKPQEAGKAPEFSGGLTGKPMRSRHEAFCQYFVLWGNASVAAGEAGYAPKSRKNQGYRLMRQARIRARIAEIRRGLADDYARDASVLLGKLEVLYQRSMEDHHFHAGVRAVEAQARIAAMSRGRVAASSRGLSPTLSGGAAEGAAKGKDDQ